MKEFAFLLLALVFQGSILGQTVNPQLTDQALPPGVVVEEVKKNSAAEKAGLRTGDTLLSWNRGDASGIVESPFDISMIAIEQAPRGAISLNGRRGSESSVWILMPGLWGLETRPSLPKNVLVAYLEGQRFANAGKWAEAAEQWRTAANQMAGSTPILVRVWLLAKAGGEAARSRQWKEADVFYQQAIQLADQYPPFVRGLLLRAWAGAYRQRRDFVNAEKYYREALAENQKLGSENLLVVAINYNDLGTTAWIRDDLDKAEDYLRQGLDIRQKLAPGSLDVATSLHNLGTIIDQRGDLAEAEQYYQQALEIRQKMAPSSLEVATSLNNLGGVAFQRGDLDKADHYHQQALEIRQELASSSLEVASSFNNLGLVASQRGYLAKAEQFYQQALKIQENLAPGSVEVARSFNNLGIVAQLRGDLAKAEQYYKQALKIKQNLAPINSSLDVSNSLNNLGIVAQLRGDLAKAEQNNQQALKIRQELAPGSLAVAASLDNLGTVAWRRGETPKAEHYFDDALKIQQNLAPESLEVAGTLIHLGLLANQKGDLAKAEEYYQRALEVGQKLAPGSLDFANALLGLAGVFQRREHLDRAAQLYGQALDVLDNQMAIFGGSEESRSNFRSQFLDSYRSYIDLLLQQKQPELAFQVLERSRARGMLETLAAAHVDIHHGVDPSLSQQEHSLQANIRAKAERRIHLLNEKHTVGQITGIEQEINALVIQYQDVEGRIRDSSKAYAALTQPHSLSAREVQQFLDADTVLLEYSLGEERSHAFVVTSSSLTAYELPKRGEIETAGRHLYELLTAWDKVSPKTAAAPANTQHRKVQLQKAATALSQMILGPIAEPIRGKRLLVVSDGVLQYIPFAALPVPGNHHIEKVPLVVENEIITLPSASVLAELRRQRADRQEAPNAVAVLADPVFDKNDERVRLARLGKHKSERQPPCVSGSLSASSNGFLGRPISDVGLPTGKEFYLPRLPFTRREAQKILTLTPAGKCMVALDFEANRVTMLSPELAQYRIVHLATHGLVDSVNPGLSGLVFSLVDQQGKEQDGFLGLQDIYNLNLNAELVVLSACKTGLGKEIAGEGLIGMTRGFMYAGTSRVVASLWNAEDAATAELMGDFYRAMERDKMRPAAALRHAQIAMWKQKRWNDPYYWAGFEIQGDWK